MHRTLIFIFILIILTSCDSSSQALTTQPFLLTTEQSVGQSFVARHDGLKTITLELAPDATPATGVLELHLYSDSTHQTSFGEAMLAVSVISSPGNYEFLLNSPLSSRQESYYLEIRLKGSGAVNILTTPQDSYVDGNIYIDNNPHSGDLIFEPHFALSSLSLDWLRRIAWWVLVALATGVCILLPGLALLSLGWRKSTTLPLVTRLCLGLGLGSILPSILLLWTRAIGLQLGSFHVWIPTIISSFILLWHYWQTHQSKISPSPRPSFQHILPDIALIVVTIVLLGVRLLPLSEVEVPLWGDSYQHAMITQLMLDQGGLFTSWFPYIPYTTMTVQYGFSAIAAMFAWTMGVDGVAATLIAGQVLNVAAALTIYPLARRISGDRPWAGVVAVVVAGFLSSIPGYYFNWGRYAQLAGQVALPTMLWLLWAHLEDTEQPWPSIPLLSLTLAGMLLNYYRMAFFFAVFVLLVILIVALPRWWTQPRRAISDLGGLIFFGILSVIVLIPWIINVANSTLASKINEVSYGSFTLIEAIKIDYTTWTGLPGLIPWYLLGFALLGSLLGLVFRQWMLAALIPWVLLVAAVFAGQLINLPAAGLMSSFAVMIAMYIPVSIACGALFAFLVDILIKKIPSLSVFTFPLVVLLMILGVPQQAAILNPASILVSRPDIEAMRWIESNTPPESRFLVNGFRIYAGTSAVGADAGWWIPLLAHRANTMPPQYAMLSEQSIPNDYTQQAVNLIADLEQHPLGSPEALKTLCTHQITHIYIGQGQGSVGFGAQSRLDANQLRTNPNFTLVYQQNLVSIFVFHHETCESNS